MRSCWNAAAAFYSDLSVPEDSLRGWCVLFLEGVVVLVGVGFVGVGLRHVVVF